MVYGYDNKIFYYYREGIILSALNDNAISLVHQVIDSARESLMHPS